ncbi:hypothetical protein [uncultured Streptomyces sp.]|uniref:hypothetical protein n=1 Tax=uncultured Streptomyces sp. TaxID=174707 RepID=UPI002617A9A7|nr:hypothetical protein [uncultured Streptomyces sp.]
MNDNREPAAEPSDSAADEVLREIEDAETDDVTSGERADEDGEAADALTPNEQAQEEVRKNA